jgi:hypothetical protein
MLRLILLPTVHVTKSSRFLVTRKAGSVTAAGRVSDNFAKRWLRPQTCLYSNTDLTNGQSHESREGKGELATYVASFYVLCGCLYCIAHA